MKMIIKIFVRTQILGNYNLKLSTTLISVELKLVQILAERNESFSSKGNLIFLSGN